MFIDRLSRYTETGKRSRWFLIDRTTLRDLHSGTIQYNTFTNLDCRLCSWKSKKLPSFPQEQEHALCNIIIDSSETTLHTVCQTADKWYTRSTIKNSEHKLWIVGSISVSEFSRKEHHVASSAQGTQIIAKFRRFQEHMLKIVVVFRLPFYAIRESHKLLTSLEYLDRSNLYEITVFGLWQVVQQLGTMITFSSAVVLIRESSESFVSEKTKTFRFQSRDRFGDTEQIKNRSRFTRLAEGKNYAAIVYFLKATCKQKNGRILVF